MPDRIQRNGETTEILLDTVITGTVPVSFTDSVGREAGTGQIEQVGSGKTRVTFQFPPDHPRSDGAWTMNHQSLGSLEFMVGPTKDMTLQEIIINSLYRVGDTVQGKIDAISGQAITDLTLIGGEGNYTGAWFIPGPESNARGRYFRVDNYNGSTLQLAESTQSLLAEGDTFFLSVIDPFEVQNQVNEGFYTVLGMSHQPARVVDLDVDSDGCVPVPNGWGYLTDIRVSYDTDSWSRPDKLTRRQWEFTGDGRIFIDKAARHIDHVNLSGTREGRPPLWEDSYSDYRGAAICDFVATNMNQNRARGNATDPNDHSRRMVGSLNKLESMLSRFADRVPNGARRIE